ncbi:hypothetical protein [Bradyrhizobium japonicum]|uniref:hypothetical protein n=1 Tax=Bradyrhizobium japonicum TaxID=375 RepID=UPI00351438D0
MFAEAAIGTIHTGNWKRPALWFNNPKMRSLMSESFPLTEPEGVVASLIEPLKSGKVSALIEMFDPKCVFVEDDGRAVTGHADIAVRLERRLREVRSPH